MSQIIYQERNIRLDLLRCIACIFIICMHSPIPNEQANGIFLSSLSYFTAPGLVLFFIISGALLLPVKLDTQTFLKKRLTKVVCPTVFWSIIYLIAQQVIHHDVNWIQSILSIPISPQGNSILWFMYTLIGLYLLAPIISQWLLKCTKKELEFYLVLWLITLCYPILKIVLSINSDNTNILFYFSGYLGYFILGYYLKKYQDSVKWIYVLPLTAIAILAPIICKILHWAVDFYELFWYLSIFVCILAICYFKIGISFGTLLTRNTFIKKSIVKFSNLSFGIYLVQILIMRYFLWKWDFILQIHSYYLQTLVVILLTFIGSFLICYFISLLPYSNYLIGYHQK